MELGLDYTVRRDPRELDSTGHVEIVPGRYTGAHWKQGALFVWEDAFVMAEGLIRKHHPAYDHLAMNDIPRAAGLRIIHDWRQASQTIPEISSSSVAKLLNMAPPFRIDLENVIESDRYRIAKMLSELADGCANFYQDEDWISVLGM